MVFLNMEISEFMAHKCHKEKMQVDIEMRQLSTCQL